MTPVDLELLKIDRQWKKELKQNPGAALYICSGEKHEVQLFDGLMKSKMGDDDDGDIFLLHYQDFNSKDSYGQSLFNDWQEYYSMWQEKEKGIEKWQIDILEDQDTDAYKAFLPLLKLKKIFKALNSVSIFLYIAPEKINDREEFAVWVEDWCKISDNSEDIKIKMIWSEHHIYKTLPKISKSHKFRINVDIHQLMQNTAAHTNQKKNSPDTDFQQKILTASNHLSKQRFPEAEQALKDAARLAKELKNLEGEVTCYFMLSQVYNANDRTEEAEVTFQKIFNKVEKGSVLEIQMLMNYGGFLLGRSKKNDAEQAFLKGAEISKSIGNYEMAMECYRIIGAFSDSKTSKSKMIQYYEKAVEQAEFMTIESITKSSLRVTASLLIAHYGKKEPQYITLNTNMVDVFGVDWRVEVDYKKLKIK